LLSGGIVTIKTFAGINQSLLCIGADPSLQYYTTVKYDTDFTVAGFVSFRSESLPFSNSKIKLTKFGFAAGLLGHCGKKEQQGAAYENNMSHYSPFIIARQKTKVFFQSACQIN